MRSFLIYGLIAFGLAFVTAFVAFIIYHRTTGWSFEQQGAIGDAFNGFLAPFLTLLTGILIFLSFRAQGAANVAFTHQSLLENYSNTFAELKADFNGLNLRYTSAFTENRRDIIEKIGLAALKKFITKFDRFFKEKSGHPLMKNFVYICKELAALIAEIDSSALPKTKKKYLLLRINRFYIAKVQGSINDLQVKLLSNNDADDRPFNNYYKEGMSELTNAVRDIIDKYLDGGESKV